jgi:hypothetical protein
VISSAIAVVGRPVLESKEDKVAFGIVCADCTVGGVESPTFTLTVKVLDSALFTPSESATTPCGTWIIILPLDWIGDMITVNTRLSEEGVKEDTARVVPFADPRIDKSS